MVKKFRTHLKYESFPGPCDDPECCASGASAAQAQGAAAMSDRERVRAAINTLHRYADQGEHYESAYRKIDEAVETLRAALLREQDRKPSGQWVHCSPRLVYAGVDCDKTPRRPCVCPDGPGSHDHFIAFATPTEAP